MTDNLTPDQRSYCMSNIKGKDTGPERIVRSLLHRMGYRFRLHRRDLPGNPDIVLPKYKIVVFVHGCFWHGHFGCVRAKKPSTNTSFWDDKIGKNIRRDIKNQKELENLGWSALVIWQCQIKKKDEQKLCSILKSFIETF
ncbi:MAG: DNA mismatch endonuclease Vsr [Desulfobacteraceae bacterium]|nr:MAG: DNA mismatch endonuclease Vsr [Desulfobacteraceae bacterium]